MTFELQMAGLPSSPITGTSLLFIKTEHIVQQSQNKNDSPFPNGLEIIYAIENVCGKGLIEGAQRIGKLYRIYIKTEQARDKLAIEGFSFRGRHISFFTKNPFTVREQPDTVKIIIGGVPLSVANSEFEKVLLDLNVQMVSDIKFENYRDNDGKWTFYKTGRRFVYCQKPALNLKPTVRIGLWNGSLYYREQVRPTPQKHDQRRDDSSVHASNGIEMASVSIASNDEVLDLTTTGKIPPTATDGIDTTEEIGKSTSESTIIPDVDTQVEKPGDKDLEQPSSSSISESPILSRRKKNQNKLTNFVDRRSRSGSLNKRKEMVSTKTNPPPPKSMKNAPCFEKSSDIHTKQQNDWFEPHYIKNKNDYS